MRNPIRLRGEHVPLFLISVYVAELAVLMKTKLGLSPEEAKRLIDRYDVYVIQLFLRRVPADETALLVLDAEELGEVRPSNGVLFETAGYVISVANSLQSRYGMNPLEALVLFDQYEDEVIKAAGYGVKPATLANQLVEGHCGAEAARKHEQNPVAPFFENSLRRASLELTGAAQHFKRTREWLDMMYFRRLAAKEDRERSEAIRSFNAGVHSFGRAIGRLEELQMRGRVPSRWVRLFERKIRIVAEAQSDAREAILFACKSFHRRRARN